MSKESSNAVDVLIKHIIKAANDAVSAARFDKTFFGVVTDVFSGGYTVTAAGNEYKVKTAQHFDTYERVAVTAPQGDFSNLIIRKI